MTWGEVALVVLVGTVYFGLGTSGLVWLLARGTDLDRPKWQPFVVGLVLIAWYLGGIAVLTKLSQDGVIR